MSWEQLVAAAADRDSWRADVNRLKQTSQCTTKPQKNNKPQSCRICTKRTRFVFYQDKAKRAEAAAVRNDNPFKHAARQCKLVTCGNTVYTFVPLAKQLKQIENCQTAQIKEKEKIQYRQRGARAIFYDKLTAGASETEERLNFSHE